MVEKTKILFCITKSNWGGAQKYIYNLAISMPEKQFDIAVVCGGKGELLDRLSRFNIKTISIEDLERNLSIRKDFLSFLNIVKIFDLEKPNIVHLNSSKMGFVGCLAIKYINIKNKIKNLFLKEKIKPIKIIFTAHGWAFNEDRSLFQKAILKIMQKNTVYWSDTTIAVAESVKNQILDEKNETKILTIYNGIENEAFLSRKKAKDILFLKTGGQIEITPKTKIFGTISELHKNKGLIYAIQAFKMLKDTSSGRDCKMIIIGEGEERENLSSLIERAGMSKEIFLVGHIQSAKELLRAFDVFFLTSTTEALPYVLLEAGMASLPIVATNVGGISEIIDDEINGLLSRPKNSREISIMFNYIISNKEKASLFGKRIKEKILKKFNIKDCIKKTLRVYKQLSE